MILPVRDTGNRLLIDEAMASARMPLVWTYEVGRSTTALDLVADGFRAALLPQSSMNADRVAICELQTPNIARPIGLLSRLGQGYSPAVTVFKAEIHKVAAAGDFT
ncbi:LysR substrate-binding domain-containing protein [Octadecabacter temperatus]|uniref:LysR substrate-binding domain-containing protein n=1 Tax=Octadecabacter temperatus TaxID=1458307 RepID=UPI0009406DFD|nr:LysR substrate-binding domain-containing protein [Octadecabacter temperatus]